MLSRTKFDKNLTLSGICDTVTQETVRPISGIGDYYEKKNNFKSKGNY